jgi:hypothetical protein
MSELEYGLLDEHGQEIARTDYARVPVKRGESSKIVTEQGLGVVHALGLFHGSELLGFARFTTPTLLKKGQTLELKPCVHSAIKICP